MNKRYIETRTNESALLITSRISIGHGCREKVIRKLYEYKEDGSIKSYCLCVSQQFDSRAKIMTNFQPLKEHVCHMLLVFYTANTAENKTCWLTIVITEVTNIKRTNY